MSDLTNRLASVLAELLDRLPAEDGNGSTDGSSARWQRDWDLDEALDLDAFDARASARSGADASATKASGPESPFAAAFASLCRDQTRPRSDDPDRCS